MKKSLPRHQQGGLIHLDMPDDLNELNIDEEVVKMTGATADIEGIIEEEPEITVEKEVLYLPSNPYTPTKEGMWATGAWKDGIRAQEGRRLMMHLERLRECLAEEVHCSSRTEVRTAKGQKKMTRAWIQS